MPPNTFHTDEDVNGAAIRLARVLGVMIVSTTDAHLLDKDDEIHFDFAIQHGYVMVTVNVKHYAPLVRARVEQGKDYPGIVYIAANHHKNAGIIARRLAALQNTVMVNREEWV